MFTSDLNTIEKYIKNIEAVDLNDIMLPRLPQSKLYLKILGIFYLIEETNVSITANVIERVLQSTYIFNNIVLASVRVVNNELYFIFSFAIFFSFLFYFYLRIGFSVILQSHNYMVIVMVCLDTNIFLFLLFIFLDFIFLFFWFYFYFYFYWWWRGMWLQSHDMSHDVMS